MISGINEFHKFNLSHITIDTLDISHTPQSSFDDTFEKRLFTRRSDLTETILTQGDTALNAILNGGWGTITELSKAHGISRTFVDSLANRLKQLGQFIFKDKIKDPDALTQERKRSIEMMLSIRLEGCSSIGQVSAIMKRQKCDLSSLGSISQTPVDVTYCRCIADDD